MSGAMTNYELGKITHREYEAQFSRYWGHNLGETQESTVAKGRRVALALSDAIASILVAVRMPAV